MTLSILENCRILLPGRLYFYAMRCRKPTSFFAKIWVKTIVLTKIYSRKSHWKSLLELENWTISKSFNEQCLETLSSKTTLIRDVGSRFYSHIGKKTNLKEFSVLSFFNRLRLHLSLISPKFYLHSNDLHDNPSMTNYI